MDKKHLIVPALIVLAGVIYGLDRGIYIGTKSFTNEGMLIKRCQYLFVTGISELPAHGGPPIGNLPKLGMQLASQPDRLYCRIFAE